MDSNMHDLFPMQSLCVLTLVSQKLHIVYERCMYRMTALLLELLFSMLEVHGRYDWQVIAPNMHCSYFLINLLCTLTVHVHVHDIVMLR